jgi:hypothetical protein
VVEGEEGMRCDGVRSEGCGNPKENKTSNLMLKNGSRKYPCQQTKCRTTLEKQHCPSPPHPNLALRNIFKKESKKGKKGN